MSDLQVLAKRRLMRTSSREVSERGSRSKLPAFHSRLNSQSKSRRGRTPSDSTTPVSQMTLTSSPSPRDGIVLTAGVVEIPVLLEPLQELEVVLHFAVDQTIHWDGL